MAQMQISSITSTTATCSSNGTVTVTVTGGTPVYCYQINGGPCLYANAPTFTFTDLTPGTKTVTVTDGPNTTTVSATIVVEGSYKNPKVFGAPQGCGVYAQASEGLPPYQYAISLAGGPFSPLQTDPQFTPVLGSYCVRVYDACNNFTEYCGIIDISPVEFTAACCANVADPTEICVSFTDRQGLHANDPGYWFGGQPPYTYSASAAGLTVNSPDGNFNLQQLCPGWSFTITDACGNTATQVPNCMHTEVLCVDCAAGTASILTTNGVAPYIYYYQDAAGNWQPNPAGGTSGSFTGLPPAGAGDSYTFRAVDACGNQSPPLTAQCLNAKGSFDCAVQTAYIEPLTDFFPADITCVTCPASPSVTLLQSGMAAFPATPPGANTFLVTDACGASVTIHCRDTLPDISIDKSCNTIKAQMRSNYICDDGETNPHQIIGGVLYELALASQPTVIIASNATGEFTGLTAGESYIVTATHAVCGVASAAVTLFTGNDFTLKTSIRTTSFLVNGICQTGYQVIAELSPEPAIVPVFDLTGSNIYTDTTGFFADILPGNWTISTDNYCISAPLELPDWKPEMTVQMPECPNGGCVQMSGARTPAEWVAWGAGFGLDIISNADFYILDCPGFNGPQCVANWGGNICNLIPGNAYSVYLKPGTFTCPVDTISFIVDPTGTVKIDSVMLTTPVACTDTSLAAVLVTVAGGKTPIYLEVIDSISGQTLRTIYDTDNNHQIAVDSLEALKTYFFRVVDACNHTKDVSTTVILLPGVTAGYTLDCQGNLQLGTAAIFEAEYTWRDGTGAVIASGPGMWEVTTSALPGNTTYEVEIHFGNCLTHVTAVTVPGFVPPLVTLPFTDSLFCNGFQVNLTASTGPGTFTYLWNTGNTTNNITTSLPGTYEVIAANAFGCRDTASAHIDYSPVMNAGINTTPVSCFGTSTGAVQVTVTGGTPGFSYLWENSTTTASRSGLPAGQYQLTITDSLGCSITRQTAITQPPALSVTTTTVPVSCFGSTDGSAQASVSGGTPGYSYLWNTGQTTNPAAALPAGMYTVTVADNNNCTITGTATVTSPLPLSAGVMVQDVQCAGSSDGMITVLATGGSGGWIYNWSVPGGSNGVLSNVPAGDYIFTVTDQHNCTFNDTATVHEPPVLTVNITGQDLQCAGQNNGSLMAVATGGTLPFNQFTWSTGQNSAALNALSAGSYTVTATDGNGCTAAASFQLTAPAPLVVTTSATPVSCINGEDGATSVMVTGGTAPYQYKWSVAMQSTAGINQLMAGQYTVTVTDSHNCTATAIAIVSQPTLIQTSLIISPVKCFGASTGVITVQTTGGTPGYNFLWSNGSTTESIENLPAGNYTLTVTDQHNCTLKTNGTVTAPPPLVITDITATGSGCNGNDGTAEVSVSGGTPPWSGLWSTGENGLFVGGLSAATYTVTITDDNGCTADSSVTVMGLDPIMVEFSLQQVSCYGESDGVLIIENITGGNGAPYLLDGMPVSAGTSVGNLDAGQYSWTITDSGNCSQTIVATITEPPLFTFTLPAILQIDLGDQVLLEPQVNSFPKPPISWQWTPPTGLSCDSCAATMAFPFQTTQYQLIGTDANGCMASGVVRVQVNRRCNVYVPNIFTPETSGPNDLLVVYAGNCVKRIVRWEIFDRWGELILSKKDFLPNDFSNAWDGTYRNKRAENGVYVLYVKYELVDGTTGLLTGNVTIAN